MSLSSAFLTLLFILFLVIQDPLDVLWQAGWHHGPNPMDVRRSLLNLKTGKKDIDNVSSDH